MLPQLKCDLLFSLLLNVADFVGALCVHIGILCHRIVCSVPDLILCLLSYITCKLGAFDLLCSVL